MKVKEVAALLGKCQEFVRVGLHRNLLPFGVAVKMSSKWTYYISEQKLREFIGKGEAR